MGTGANDVDIDIGANSKVTINSVGATEIDIDAFNDPGGCGHGCFDGGHHCR